MIKKIEYTETYKETLSATVSIMERDWDEKYVNRFLDQLDDVVEKIRTHPYLFQAIPINPKYRRCVISKQTSLVYEVTDSKIILLYLFDNRQEPLWD
ncbi:type II toxin-antitoxin system RelE/ParE family toxin [Parapedobacter koreensis]|uniref:type II toxin-antitoxin system RelE/ParE family toxin n=1 Tax=Parapedobacter koreensis TaxID=332977 RepID=UPI000B85235D|nr:hypothetical protein [Parapedobacter koreensis]